MKRVGGKGLSTIVATLIIILLVFVAVGIIWAVVRGVIQGGSEDIASKTKCFESQVNVVKVNNTAGSNYIVTLSRISGNDEIGGVKVIFEDDDSDNNYIFNSEGNILSLGTRKETITVEGLASPDKVRAVIYFVNDEGKETLCESADEFEIN